MIKPTLGRIALAFSLLAAAGAAQADLLDNIKQARKLRVAIELALPPYGMTNDKMQPYGSDVETAQLLAKDLGVELEIVPATGPTRIPFLQTNKADLAIATLSISPDRQKVIDFSVPYSVVQIVVAAPKSMNIKGYGDLVGKKIAITRGNVQEMELVQKAVGAQIVRYDDDATLVTAGVSGQAPIVSTATTLLQAIQTKAPGRELETKFVVKEFNLGIGMRKEEPKLLAWINDWVKANRANGKLNEIFKKYHHSELPPLPAQ
ncbi:amino acid ABC transporter [Variovorax paradoxus]|uniref:transporter substrate-binding domain-containing protein n=1 Tax=Variovorax TaxID=34072 RepID=UPI0006E6DF20|nr:MULTISPECIES: transporter substrate-binding domain-containing protein [unclassified Variovorax]KPU89402.1 amino acid ABC transporter [Variovorax paradoxus]KPV00819.1 amino acid ABC transporter [Variovorax paradoxus]KPV01682.1 amino acid ABC transporter [Variovorax paradoxus]KPV17132.1 amino acid ABC transporter [Variovorax paradoxus]KPV26920.1 amino acid ABC transporter [Variovorax paradoxus]